MTARRSLLFAAALMAALAVFGWNPLAAHRNTDGLLVPGYSGFETGVSRQPNGVYRVRALTRMPGVKAEMVRWWFADYMRTPEHYRRWHPTAHVWMDWENKTTGEVIGASHLVHEYLGGDLYKLRIQFVNPAEYLGEAGAREDGFIVCARAGDLETPINYTTMCHVVRDTAWGAEMRSVFWMGHVSRRAGNENIFSMEGLVANTWIARMLLIDSEFATDLMSHAIEEMGYLADFLPDLYASENGGAGDAGGISGYIPIHHAPAVSQIPQSPCFRAISQTDARAAENPGPVNPGGRAPLRSAPAVSQIPQAAGTPRLRPWWSRGGSNP